MEFKNLDKIVYLLVFILVVDLWIYENVNIDVSEDSFSVQKYLLNPEKYGDYKAESLAKIISISPDYFYVNFFSTDIKVMGSGVEEPILGETVVYLNFRKDGVIELIDYHNYNFNYFLYGVSFFSLIVFVIIFFMEWKITWRGFKDA